MNRVQQTIEQTPTWLNWVIIGGSAAASWLAPIASIVAIVWGCLNIYSWIVNKGWRPRKNKDGRGR